MSYHYDYILGAVIFTFLLNKPLFLSFTDILVMLHIQYAAHNTTEEWFPRIVLLKGSDTQVLCSVSKFFKPQKPVKASLSMASVSQDEASLTVPGI